METKEHIRKRMLAARNAMPSADRAKAGGDILEKLSGLPAYQSADTILGFAGYGSEVDTLPFLEESVRKGKKVYCPVSNPDGTMEFYRFTKKDDLVRGYKNIPEPPKTAEKFNPDAQRIQNTSEVFLLMPGVAFDRYRHRVGYGKGYYDKYLSKFMPDYMAAVCFQCQIAEEIPAEEFDKIPDIVITEEQIYI